MSLLLLIEAAPLVVIASVATFGIYSKKFQDNLLQRIGLSGIAFGATLKLAADLQAEPSHAACTILIYGAAIYAAGCITHLATRKK